MSKLQAYQSGSQAGSLRSWQSEVCREETVGNPVIKPSLAYQGCHVPLYTSAGRDATEATLNHGFCGRSLGFPDSDAMPWSWCLEVQWRACLPSTAFRMEIWEGSVEEVGRVVLWTTCWRLRQKQSNYISTGPFWTNRRREVVLCLQHTAVETTQCTLGKVL